MASTSAIDTEAVGSGLRAANETSENAVADGLPSNPAGMYVAGTATELTGLLTAAVSALGVTVAEGTAATAATVVAFDAAEEANQASLST